MGTSCSWRACRRIAIAWLALTGLPGCITPGENIPEQAMVDVPTRPPVEPAPAGSPSSRRGVSTVMETPGPRFGSATPLIVRGSGDEPVKLAEAKSTTAREGGYVLNFDNADIRDVAKAVLNDMLGLGYAVDPGVQGAITLRTARPLTREAVLPAFEEALKLAGAALVPGASGYQIVPLQGAAQRGALGTAGNALQPGYRSGLFRCAMSPARKSSARSSRSSRPEPSFREILARTSSSFPARPAKSNAPSERLLSSMSIGCAASRLGFFLSATRPPRS
jgi:GspD-like, N0 domain